MSVEMVIVNGRNSAKCEDIIRGPRACHPSVQLKAKPGPTLGLAKEEELSQTRSVPSPLAPLPSSYSMYVQ